jgi:uncharacterized protein
MVWSETLQQNKAIVEKLVPALMQGDVATLHNILAPDVQLTTMGSSVVSGTRNHADIIGAVEMLSALFPAGISTEVLSITAEEDRVSCEVESHAVTVAGVRYDNHYHFLVWLRGGKVCRIKEYLDTKLTDQVFAPFVARVQG